jgi:hypothetical protein
MHVWPFTPHVLVDCIEPRLHCCVGVLNVCCVSQQPSAQERAVQTQAPAWSSRPVGHWQTPPRQSPMHSLQRAPLAPQKSFPPLRIQVPSTEQQPDSQVVASQVHGAQEEKHSIRARKARREGIELFVAGGAFHFEGFRQKRDEDVGSLRVEALWTPRPQWSRHARATGWRNAANHSSSRGFRLAPGMNHPHPWRNWPATFSTRC